MKLTITVLMIGLVVGGVNIYQIATVDRVNNLSKELIDKDVQRLNALQSISLNSSTLQYTIEDYHLESEGKHPESAVGLKPSITEQTNKLKQAVQAYHTATDTDKTVPSQQLTSLYATTDTLVQQTQQAIKTPNDAVFSSITKSNTQLQNTLKELIGFQQQAIADKKDDIASAIKQVKLMFVVVTIGVTLASILICVILAKSIATSLSKLRKSAQRIANGDFSVPAVVSGNDEMGQLAKSFNDMSERLRDSYRRIAIEQQRDEAILQSMGEGLIATDENGKILLINHVAADYFGVADQASVVGEPIKELYELYNADDKSDTPLTDEKRPVFIALSTKATVHDVFAFHRGDGEKTLLDITATPIIFTDKVVGAISVMRDVTKEKQIDRMKTEFISLASHQLRTPLSAIKWFTEMLVSGDAGKLSPDQMEFAKNIDDSTERMIALVNALLNISRIESGRIIIDPKPTDLQELVTGIINDLKAKTEERQQTLVISVHQGLPKINLDPRLIGQVYLNLLTNAVKYTQKGGEISVFISRKDDQIISQITDNGYGIPKDQQDRVFQKFFRAANAVKVETDGTGLGLYLIKAVVESSGGKIWFKSEEGKGTTFWFSIPVSGMKPKEGEVTLDV